MFSNMDDESWAAIDHFSKDEKWGDPYKIVKGIVFALDKLRAYVDRPIIVHCAYDTSGHTAKSTHYRGLAVDIHIAGMHVVDQYIAASRFPDFRGIGVYPFWNNPGLHLDLGAPGRRWGRNKSGVYVNLDWAFLSSLAS